MNKIYQHTNFTKLSKTGVFGIAFYALVKLLFFDSIFDKNSFGMALFLTILFSALSIFILYIILDIWIERILISHNKIIYFNVLRKKEILNSNIKGFFQDGRHTSIYSKDESVIITFDNRLKSSDEKLISYLYNHYEDLDDEE